MSVQMPFQLLHIHESIVVGIWLWFPPWFFEHKKKLSVSQISNLVIVLFLQEYIGPFWCLRAALGPLVETYILLDRLLFLQEQSNLVEALLFPLFDPTMSPRNMAIIAWKLSANSSEAWHGESSDAGICRLMRCCVGTTVQKYNRQILVAELVRSLYLDTILYMLSWRIKQTLKIVLALKLW